MAKQNPFFIKKTPDKPVKKAKTEEEFLKNATENEHIKQYIPDTVPFSVVVNKETSNLLEDIALFYDFTSKSKALEFMLKDIAEKEGKQDRFLDFIATFKEEQQDSIVRCYKLPISVKESIEGLKKRFRLLKTAHFVRYLIYFYGESVL
jgi:hypothetical protein